MNTRNPYAIHPERAAVSQASVYLLFGDSELGEWIRQLLSFSRSPKIAATLIPAKSAQSTPINCDLLIADGEAVLLHGDAVLAALANQTQNPACLLVIKEEQLPSLMPQLATLARLGVDQFTLHTDFSMRLVIDALNRSESTLQSLDPLQGAANRPVSATSPDTSLAPSGAAVDANPQLHNSEAQHTSTAQQIIHPIAIDLGNQRVHVESVTGSPLCADEDILESLDSWNRRLSTTSKNQFVELFERARAYEPIPRSLAIELDELASHPGTVVLESIQLKNNGQGRVVGASAELRINAAMPESIEPVVPDSATGFDNLSDSSELLNAEKAWQNIARSLPMQCLLVDEDGLVVQVINEGDRSNPCLPALITGVKLTDLLNIDSLDDLSETIRRTVNTGKPHHQVVAYSSEHGLRWLDTHITKLSGDSGLSRQAVWTAFDITSSRHAYQELLKSRDSIAQIIDDAPFLFFQKDNAGRYLRANKEFCRFFNVNVDAIASHTDSEIFSDTQPEFARVTEHALAMAESNAQTSERIVYTQTIDGRTETFNWQILLGKRNSDSQVDTLCGFGMTVPLDQTSVIDSSQNQDDSSEDSNVQPLEQVTSLAMSGALQQDLKIILNALVSYAELGLSQKNPQRNKSIAEALSQIESTARRTHDMMQADPAPSSEQGGFEPEPVVRDIVDMLSPTLPASVAIETQLNAAHCRIEADVNVFKQIVMLLLLNAKSTAGSGSSDSRILLELVEQEALSETCSACGATLEGNYLSLSVETPTPSIDEAGFERLLEAARQSSQSSAGNNVIALAHRSSGHTLIQRHENATRLQLLFPLT